MQDTSTIDFRSYRIEVTREPWCYVLRFPVVFPKGRVIRTVKKLLRGYGCGPRLFAMMQFLVSRHEDATASAENLMSEWNETVKRKDWRFPNTPLGLAAFRVYVRRAKQLMRSLNVQAHMRDLPKADKNDVTSTELSAPATPAQ